MNPLRQFGINNIKPISDIRSHNMGKYKTGVNKGGLIKEVDYFIVECPYTGCGGVVEQFGGGPIDEGTIECPDCKRKFKARMYDPMKD